MLLRPTRGVKRARFPENASLWESRHRP